MRPNERQKTWLKKHLPKHARPIDVVPRAYCVLKPAPLCAAFAMPHVDLRKHLAPKENAKYNSGVIIDSSHSWMVSTLCQGDWATLVYAELSGDSILWYCTPPMPYNLFKETTNAGRQRRKR